MFPQWKETKRLLFVFFAFFKFLGDAKFWKKTKLKKYFVFFEKTQKKFWENLGVGEQKFFFKWKNK
jgi:hypothetical protein